MTADDAEGALRILGFLVSNIVVKLLIIKTILKSVPLRITSGLCGFGADYDRTNVGTVGTGGGTVLTRSPSLIRSSSGKIRP